jgi:RecB family exonuclease
MRRLSVSEWLTRDDPPGPRRESRSPDSALIGLLVHRLFQAFNRGLTGADPRAAAAALMRPEERAVTLNLDHVISTAIDLWAGLRRRGDVAAVLASAEVLAEVPFSLRIEEEGVPILLRGTIDCLAIAADGTVSVVELKTGGRRESHQRQLDLYVRAARALFPGRQVQGHLIHA